MFWDCWENHLLSGRFQSCEVPFLREYIPEYVQWYLRVSHMYMQNPESRSTYNVGQSSHTRAPSMSDDPCLVGALGYLKPIVDRGFGYTPYDDIYHVVEESIHLLHNLILDLYLASQDITTPTAFERRNLHTFFCCKHRNSKN